MMSALPGNRILNSSLSMDGCRMNLIDNSALTLIAIFMQDISSFLNTWTADSKLKLYLKIPYSGSTYVRSFDSGLKKLFNET